MPLVSGWAPAIEPYQRVISSPSAQNKKKLWSIHTMGYGTAYRNKDVGKDLLLGVYIVAFEVGED